MPEHQFINRLGLIVIFGIVYIYTMTKMASYNSKESTPQKHTALRIIGSIILLSSVLDIFLGIYLLMQIQYPEQIIDFSYTPYQNVRPSNVFIAWGYPTSQQNLAIMSITNIFSTLALASYCFFYRKSNSKWYEKILKFIYGLFLYLFYCSATDLHYFDASEMVVPGLFCLMAGYASIKANRLNSQKEQQSEQQRIAAIHSELNQKFAKEAESKEDDKRFIPHNEDLDVNNPTEEDETQTTNISLQANITNREQASELLSAGDYMKTVKYCRHCGKEVGCDSSKYCKHCGKEL